MRKIILPLLMFVFLLQLSSCSDDDDVLEDVTIEFINPTDGQQFDLADVEVFVFNAKVTADKDLHDIFFRAFPTNDPSDMIVDRKTHRHDKEIELNYERDLSAYPSGTEFTIEVEVCIDHDCDLTPIQESITFTVV